MFSPSGKVQVIKSHCHKHFEKMYLKAMCTNVKKLSCFRYSQVVMPEVLFHQKAQKNMGYSLRCPVHTEHPMSSGKLTRTSPQHVCKIALK